MAIVSVCAGSTGSGPRTSRMLFERRACAVPPETTMVGSSHVRGRVLVSGRPVNAKPSPEGCQRTRTPLARDWARAEQAAALTKVITQHAGGSGIAYLWEQQLLNTPVPAQAK